jgi:hypothetical protein
VGQYFTATEEGKKKDLKAVKTDYTWVSEPTSDLENSQSLNHFISK